MAQIVQVVDAKPGFNAVLVNVLTGKPEFHPVVLWGLLEEGCDCPECQEAGRQEVEQGVVPLIVSPKRCGQTLLPAFQFETCIGVASPDDAPENWKAATDAFLAMRATGMMQEPQPENMRWN